jgi:hypothetical protein
MKITLFVVAAFVIMVWIWILRSNRKVEAKRAAEKAAHDQIFPEILDDMFKKDMGIK